jgi:OOP family OmpA-OmpF porin
MNIKPVIVGAIFALGWPLAAWAGDSSYSAQQIVDFFAHSTSDMGAARGICVGTEEECSTGKPAAQAERVFNLQVNFGLDSAELSEGAKANLLEFAKALKDPSLAAQTFAIEGFTDARGSSDYNLGLSERRAEAVATFLSQHDIDTSKFVIKGYGETKPITDNPYDDVNRRVETRVIMR